MHAYCMMSSRIRTKIKKQSRYQRNKVKGSASTHTFTSHKITTRK